MKMTPKKYACKKCGHTQMISTNHYLECYSFGHFSTCPKCPPHAKYPEFGGSTTWICQEKAPINPEPEKKEMEQGKDFIICDVLRGRYDCTINGVSSRYDDIFVFAEGTDITTALEYMDSRGKARELAFIVETVCTGTKRASQITQPGGMFGGHYAVSSDSRYTTITGLKYPIALMDRVEKHD